MYSKVVCLALLVLACVSVPQAFASEQETVASLGGNVSVSLERCLFWQRECCSLLQAAAVLLLVVGPTNTDLPTSCILQSLVRVIPVA
jgi:hypothetical protein